MPKQTDLQKAVNDLSGIANIPYIVSDSDGNRVDMVKGNAALAQSALNKTPLQKNPETGEYELFQSSISFNKDTGNLTIKAPKAYLEQSDWLKENFTNNDNFKALASALKVDPEGTTAVKYTDEDGKEKEITLNDMLSKYQEAFAEYTSQYQQVMDIRNAIQKGTKSGITMSDQDVVIWADSRNRGEDKFSDQKAVWLPSIAFSYFDFTTLPSYNAEANTISAKDFYNWYNLDDGTKNKDDIVLNMTKAVEQTLAFYTNFEGEKDNPDADTAEVANQYARLNSFYNTLMADNPDANILTSTRLFIQSAANSFGANILKASGNVANALNDFSNFLDEVDDYIWPAKVVTAPLKLATDTYRLGTDMFYKAGAVIAGVDTSVSEQTKKELQEMSVIGTLWECVADGDIDALVSVVEKSSGIEGKTDLRDALNTIEAIDKSNNADLTRLASSATAGMIFGGALAEVAKQIVVTNPVGATAGAATYRVLGAAESVKDGMAIVSGAMSAKEIAGAIKVASFGSNIVAQGITDTVLNDEIALRKLFTEGDAGDAVRALGLNMVYNGMGEISGLATTKGWTAFKKTAVGESIESAEQKAVATIQSKKQRALTRVAEWLNSKKKTPVEGADYMTSFSKAEIEASENIVNAATKEARKEAVQGKVDLEVAFTRANTQLGRTTLDLQTDARVAKYWRATEDTYGAIVKAEGGAGIKVGDRAYITQSAADYVTISNRLEYFAAKSGGDLSTLSKAEANYAEALAKRATKFENESSPELLSAVKEYIKKLKSYYSNANDMFVQDGLMDSEWLSGLRATGFWGKNGQNYIFTQAVKGDQTAAAEKLVKDLSSGKNWKAKTMADQYSYKPGDVDAHYMDPQLAAFSQQTAMAKVKDSREFADALRKTQTLFKEIDTDGKPVSYKELSKIRSEVQTSANKVFKEFKVNDDILQYEFANTYKEIEAIPTKVAKKEKAVAKLLDMSDDRLVDITLDLNAEQISALGKQFDLPDYQPIKTRAELNEIYYGGSDAQRVAIDQCLGIDNLTVANYNKALVDTDLAEWLTRTYIVENSDIMTSAKFKEFATGIRANELTARQQLILKKNYDKIAELQKQAKLVETGADEFTATIAKFTDDVASTMKKELKDNKFFDAALKQYTDAGVSKRAATNYLVLDQMKKSMAKSNNDFNQALNKNLTNMTTSGNLTTRQKTRWAKAVKESVKDNIDSEWAKAVKVLQKNGAGALVDTEAVYKEIYDLMDDFIEGQIKNDTVIQVLDENGNYHLYEVAPHTAYLYKNRMNFSNVKNNAVVKLFTRTNRLFRLMTTGWSISSFENQWMRDPMNAYIMGGFARGINTNTEQLGRMLGENVVESMKEEIGKAGWADLVEASGKATDAEALASTVAKRGEMLYGDTAMGTEYYRTLMRGRKTSLLGDYQEEVGKMEKAMRFLEDKSPGDFREKYLRKAVYSQAFNDAISMNKTWKEASKIAEFVADNATTDFSRAFAWGTSITSSVPYLGAAINGTKSFWRLLEIDPVGVSGRFISGLVIPALALTAKSLDGEMNRQTYMNIPEYVKEDNLVFVVNGQAFKVPIPQELSNFLAPFRQVAEKAQGANNNAWSELILNDLLGVSPIDLKGFANLNDPMGLSDDFFSRLSSEGEALISQLSPTLVKTMYMLATHRDPYTGQSIDHEYTYIDEDGILQVMDNEDNAIARWFSSVCRGIYEATGWEMFNISPSVAEKVLGGFMGQAGIDLFGSVSSLFTGDLVGSLSVYGNQMSKPFRATNYNLTNSAWKEFVKGMETEKAKLMAPDGDLWKINNQIKYTTDPAKLDTLKAQYRQKVQEYQDTLFNGVQKFNSIYGSDYDWKKFSTTINLLDFGGTAQDLTSTATQNLVSELSFDAKEKAKQTMMAFGFNSTNDLSIFGYAKTDSQGNVEWKSTTPTAILSMDNMFYQSKDETVAEIENTIKNIRGVDGKTLKDKYNEMSKKEDEYYDTKNYDALNDLYKEWDIELMASIYPILAKTDLTDKYGNSLIENSDLIDLLDNYIRVPSDYMGKGKYISAKTGLNKNRGYAKSYIEYLYKQIGGEK